MAENKNQQIGTRVFYDKFWIPFKPHIKALSLVLSQEHSLFIMFSFCVCLCVCSLFQKNYTSSLSSTDLKSFCHDTTVHLNTGKLVYFNFCHTYEEKGLEASKELSS